jgi:hypothetical protein
MSSLKPDFRLSEPADPFGFDPPAEGAWQKTGKYFPHCRPCVLEQVEALAAYPANWDGYGAPPVSRAGIAAVRAFLNGLPDELFIRPYKEADCLIPAVVPMSSGAIQLEWHVGRRILELEFETPTTIHYLKWWPDEGIEDEGTYPAADCRFSSRLIEWVLRGHDPE